MLGVNCEKHWLGYILWIRFAATCFPGGYKNQKDTFAQQTWSAFTVCWPHSNNPDVSFASHDINWVAAGGWQKPDDFNAQKKAQQSLNIYRVNWPNPLKQLKEPQPAFHANPLVCKHLQVAFIFWHELLREHYFIISLSNLGSSAVWKKRKECVLAQGKASQIDFKSAERLGLPNFANKQ